MSQTDPSDQLPRWGIVATILASPSAILRFAAYHLEAGAHRLYLYIDADSTDAFAELKAHPKIRVTLCDAAYWRKLMGKRPVKHQTRQSLNATHAYNRRIEVDWLTHIDVDEFLVSDQKITAVLSKVDSKTQTLRMRPMEVLAGDGTAFKSFIPSGPNRAATVQSLYPTYGAYLKSGFLSHVSGKIFVRSGLRDIKLRIHNVFHGDVKNPAEIEQDVISLAHCHATSWEAWKNHYHYRLAKGSYRADLAPPIPESAGGLNLNALLSSVETTKGEAGLRAFFDEACADTPDLRRRLNDKGLLRSVDLGLDATLKRQFPDFAG